MPHPGRVNGRVVRKPENRRAKTLDEADDDLETPEAVARYAEELADQNPTDGDGQRGRPADAAVVRLTGD